MPAGRETAPRGAVGWMSDIAGAGKPTLCVADPSPASRDVCLQRRRQTGGRGLSLWSGEEEQGGAAQTSSALAIGGRRSNQGIVHHPWSGRADAGCMWVTAPAVMTMTTATTRKRGRRGRPKAKQNRCPLSPSSISEWLSSDSNSSISGEWGHSYR